MRPPSAHSTFSWTKQMEIPVGHICARHRHTQSIWGAMAAPPILLPPSLPVPLVSSLLPWEKGKQKQTQQARLGQATLIFSHQLSLFLLSLRHTHARTHTTHSSPLIHFNKVCSRKQI